jgi:hypothetical protein
MSKMTVTVTSELRKNRRKYDPFQGLAFNLLQSLSKSSTNLDYPSQFLSQFSSHILSSGNVGVLSSAGGIAEIIGHNNIYLLYYLTKF